MGPPFFMFKLLVFFLFFQLSEVYARPSWAPSTSCEKTWSHLKDSGLDHYHFESDSQITENGNIGYQKYKKRVKRDKCSNKWTVLIYMAADNDLSAYSFWDLYEMERQIKGELNLGASSDDIDVIVEWDNKNRSGLRRMHIFQSEKEYDASLKKADFEKMTEKDILSPIVQILPETGPGSLRDQSKRFQSFLQWGVENYPSDHYMVVVWGHGEGFIGQHYERRMRWDQMQNNSRRAEQSRLLLKEDVALELNLGKELPSNYPVDKVFGGVAFDYSDLSFLDIPTTAKILDNLVEWTLEGQKIDILGFDACLMQSIEVAGQFNSNTQFIFGSTQVQNYLGLPYRTVIDQLHTGKGPSEMAFEIPTLIDRSFRQGYQGSVDPEGQKTFTASSFNLAALEYELFPAMQDMSKAMITYLKEDGMRVIDLNFILEQNEAFQGETRDVGVFLGAMLKLLYLEAEQNGETESMFDLRAEIQETLSVLHRMTLARAYGDIYTTQVGREAQTYLLGYFKGLGIWIPRDAEQFEHRKKEFEQSQLWQSAPEWSQVLEIIYTEPEL